MKAVIAKVKKSVSLVLAVMMVLTAIPQTSYAVYGADQSISENDTLNVDTETTVDETAATEETVEAPVEVIEEDILEDDSLEVEEETLLMEDTPSGKFRFDANGGTMPIDDNAINRSEDVDGKCTWQEFTYRSDCVQVTNVDNITPSRDGFSFYGWYYADGKKLILSDGFDDTSIDRTVYAKWIKQISSTPVIVSYYGNKNGIKYIKKGNSLNVSLKVSRESFPSSELLGEGESIVLYYWYGSDETVYDGSNDTEDEYYHRWNGYPITVYNMNSDAEITFKLFDNVDFDTANVKIKLKYCIVTDGPYIRQDFTNVVGEGEECIINDTYSDISKLNFVISRTPSGYTGYSSGVKLYEKESDGYYRELDIEHDDDDNPKYEFRNGKEIALYFNGFYGCKSNPEQRNSLQPTGVFSKIPNIDEWTELEKKAINVKKDNSNPAEINLIENCYIIPANRTNSDLQIEVDTRLSKEVSKISFNNTEEAEYSVSYSKVPGEANCWTKVQNGCIDSPMTEGDIIYLRFESNGEYKKIGKITSSAGKIYKTTINGIECYKLDLNNLDSNIEDLKVNFSFIEDNEGVGEVCYYDGDVDITVMDGDTPVEGFITERISGNYSRNLYKLTNDRKYTLEIRCKDGYYFNGKGVDFNRSYTNKNTAEPYIKTNFVAGNKISAYTDKCVHLIFNNANTTYGGKGIAPSVKYYTQSDTAKTAKTITPNKTVQDGSCEYYLPVLDENSDCRYEVAVNPKDANGSPVSATLVGANPQEIKYGKNREVKIPVDSYRLGKYEWNVECVSNKAIPNITYVENDQPKTINPTTANGNIFNVPWNRQFFITEVNKEGRKSKITACSAECDGIGIGNKLTVHIGNGGDSEVIFWRLGSEYAGKTINAKLFTDISRSSGNTVTLKVAPAITKVTVSGVKSAGPAEAKYQALVQEIASTKEYAYTLLNTEKNSFDDLRVHVCAAEGSAPADNSSITEKTSNDYVDVTLNAAGKKLIVNTKNKKPSDQASYIVIFNKSTDKKVAGFYINTTTPAWAKTTPTASLVTASDVALNLKVTAPKGVTLNDNYYVAVKLSANNKTKIPEGKGLTLNDAVKYYKVSGGTIPDISINAFKKDGSETSTLGAGCGTSMDANIYLVLTSDGETPVEGAEGNVIVKAAVKKLTVATKEPYYADKISLKKGTTNLYAGQSGIKIADINLGTKTTYNTTEFWGIKSVVDAKGNDASSYITFKTGTSAGKTAADTGIYAVVDEDTPAGKYKVTVQTKDGFYAPEASIDITVLPTIDRLYLYLNTTDISDEEDEILTYTIYKPEGKSATAKAIVSGEDQDQKIIKNPKVTYTVGVKTEGNTIEAVAGLTVKNGTVTVAKDFDIDDDAQYCMYVRANDYSGNMTEDSIYLAIDDSPVNVKTLELYIEGEEEGEYELIKPGTSIPFDCMPLYAVKDKDGNYILGETVSGDTKTLKTPSLSPLGDTVVINENEALEKSLKLTKPGKVKYTAYGVDGTKASFDLSLTYNSNNDDYNNIWYDAGNGHADALGIDETGDANAVNLTGAAADSVIEIVLSDSDNGPSYDKEYDDYYMVEGSLSVINAKIIKKNANSQYLKIQMTKSPATVTLTKQVKNDETGKMEAKKYTWIFKNDALNKAKAPAATKILVKNTEDSGYAQSIYADYTYNGDNYIEITLKEPLKDADGYVMTSVAAKLSDYEGLSSVIHPASAVYTIVPAQNNKFTAKVLINMKSGSLPLNKFSFNIYYVGEDGKYLTSSPTTVTVTPAKFKKSFAVNSTQTMSLKDGYAINIATKSVGVFEVEYTGLLNYNKDGKYNNFTDLYKIDDNNRLTIKDAAAETALFAASNVDKKGYPLPMDGYVKCKVTYESGEVDYFTSKITVKWSSSQIGKYTIEKYDVPVNIYANYYVVNLWDSSKNEVSYKEIKLAKLKNDSPNITGVFEYGMGNLCVSLAANTKPGTYKSTALAVLEDSGCPHSGSQITDDEWAKYGVQVQITIKVVP